MYRYDPWVYITIVIMMTMLTNPADAGLRGVPIDAVTGKVRSSPGRQRTRQDSQGGQAEIQHSRRTGRQRSNQVEGEEVGVAGKEERDAAGSRGRAY